MVNSPAVTSAPNQTSDHGGRACGNNLKIMANIVAVSTNEAAPFTNGIQTAASGNQAFNLSRAAESTALKTSETNSKNAMPQIIENESTRSQSSARRPRPAWPGGIPQMLSSAS